MSPAFPLNKIIIQHVTHSLREQDFCASILMIAVPGASEGLASMSGWKSKNSLRLTCSRYLPTPQHPPPAFLLYYYSSSCPSDLWIANPKDRHSFCLCFFSISPFSSCRLFNPLGQWSPYPHPLRCGEAFMADLPCPTPQQSQSTCYADFDPPH